MEKEETEEIKEEQLEIKEPEEKAEQLEETEELEKEEQPKVEELEKEEQSKVEEQLEIKEPEVEEKKEENKKEGKKKSKKKKVCIILIILVLIAVLGGLCYINKDKWFGDKKESVKTTTKTVKSKYAMTGNDLQDFDITFLQIENNGKNKVYSPLSIKYALGMLAEGAKGDSKDQIVAVIGDYKSNKYTNSKNMSISNGFFVNDMYKDSVKSTFIDDLKTKYNAEIFYDDFRTPDKINNWVKDNTFKMIDKLLDDVSGNNFVLVNALAIDMEWKNVFQHKSKGYGVSYKHENFSVFVGSLESTGYTSIDFNNKAMQAKGVAIAAEANRYDIVKDLGEDNIRAEVGKEYEKWIAEGACGDPQNEPSTAEFLDNYIKELNSNYKSNSSSTDFNFYDDENIKAISKDLKEYDGTTLQYVGIMPKKDKLDDYLKNVTSKDLSTTIKNLKEIKLENFKDGVVTKIEGTIPVFKINYELKLLEDLKEIGIKDIFDISTADLTGITPTKDLFIDKAVHKATIEFSNEGIKASAATAMGGLGSASCGFDHSYDVPVETIDLTFDKPYLYLIRDKASGEVWFAGTVYEPTKYETPNYGW